MKINIDNLHVIGTEPIYKEDVEPHYKLKLSNSLNDFTGSPNTIKPTGAVVEITMPLREFKASGNEHDLRSSFNEKWKISLEPYRINIPEENIKSIVMGDTMFSFNERAPERGKDIIYLFGNGLDGVKNCKLVRGYYDPIFGDFSKDENGNFEYVTYWKYI